MDATELSRLDELYKEFIDSEVDLEYELIDNSYHRFNNSIIIPVKAIEKSINIDSADDIEIYAPNGNGIGFLCPVCYPENEFIVAQFNENRLFAFFVDRLGSLQQADRYSFLNHYVVINYSDFPYYKTVMATTEYWGGYTHKTLNASNTRTISRINIREGVKIPSVNHEESIVLAVHSASSFERFLKYYHQMELLFDSLFVAKLKKINSLDLRDYAVTMKDFNYGKKNELDALKFILKNYMVDFNSVIQKMRLVINHVAVANDMFFILGKESNPLKTHDEWTVLIKLLNINSLDPSSCFIGDQVNGVTIKLINKNDQKIFNDFIINICSYWIYRLRCCIAHNKIGEYIFSYNDEGLVSDFGEHLLLEIVKDVFSNADLHNDLGL